MRPLAGIRVLELGALIAGPFCAKILAEFGADVVKLEPPKIGDPLRTWLRDRGELWWKVYARGKRSITLNLAHPKGQALLRRLCRGADVLVENFLPGTFEKWGLGWEVLSADNPRLVFARVSGWGQDGPYRDRPGFGTMVEAMSGFAAATGEADGPPTLPSFPMADMIAALSATTAVLAALRHRDHVSGRGQEDQGVTSFLVFDPARFDEPELIAVEIECGVEIADPNHRMKVFHVFLLSSGSVMELRGPGSRGDARRGAGEEFDIATPSRVGRGTRASERVPSRGAGL